MMNYQVFEIFAGLQVQTTFSFAVGIAIRKGNRAFACSGALISPDMVVTAAHCLCGNSLNIIKVREPKFDFIYKLANLLIFRNIFLFVFPYDQQEIDKLL